jgi:hypothetical protein
MLLSSVIRKSCGSSTADPNAVCTPVQFELPHALAAKSTQTRAKTTATSVTASGM